MQGGSSLQRQLLLCSLARHREAIRDLLESREPMLSRMCMPFIPTADAESSNSVFYFWTLLTDRPDSDLSAVRSRMLFPSSGQDSSRGLPDANNWGLGLQSLSLSDWERPWSSHDTDHSVQTNTAARE